MMKRSDFDYSLPPELIAHYPTPERTGSRLLVLGRQTGETVHRRFTDLLDYVSPGDLFVFNNTRVFPARLFATKASGGKVEILVEKVLDPQTVLVHLRSNHPPKEGTVLLCESGHQAEVLGREDSLFRLFFKEVKDIFEVLHQVGHIPLPPYLHRSDEPIDRERYQTVYHQTTGSVAAPTAGLHYDQKMLENLAKAGVQLAFITLHVGAGTFMPMRVENLAEHVMHAEYIDVSEPVCEQIKATKAQGKRVFAVGTTVVRSLETAAQSGEIQPYQGETRLFIYPGYRFQVVDALQTNFHLPASTLLMLVSAFAGKEPTLAAYHQAIAEKYRFFSYGDTMLIL